MKLKIKPKNSILKNNIFYDIIDEKILDELIKNPVILKSTKEGEISELEQLRRIKQNLKNGLLQRRYDHSKNDGGGDGFGRLYQKGGGLQNLRKKIRICLTEQNYIDIDIKNAQPTILQQICVKNGINCPILTEYVKNREKIINKFEQEGYPKGSIKKLMIRLMFGGSFNEWAKEYGKSSSKPYFIQEFISETKKLMDIIYEANYQQITKYIIDEKEKQNIKGSVMSRFLQYYENKILETIYFFFKEKGFIKDNHCTLMFDGMMIPKNAFKDIDETSKINLLKECQQEISKQNHFEIEIVEKKIKHEKNDEEDLFFIEYIINNIHTIKQDFWDGFDDELHRKICDMGYDSHFSENDDDDIMIIKNSDENVEEKDDDKVIQIGYEDIDIKMNVKDNLKNKKIKINDVVDKDIDIDDVVNSVSDKVEIDIDDDVVDEDIDIKMNVNRNKNKRKLQLILDDDELIIDEPPKKKRKLMNNNNVDNEDVFVRRRSRKKQLPSDDNDHFICNENSNNKISTTSNNNKNYMNISNDSSFVFSESSHIDNDSFISNDEEEKNYVLEVDDNNNKNNNKNKNNVLKDDDDFIYDSDEEELNLSNFSKEIQNIKQLSIGQWDISEITTINDNAVWTAGNETYYEIKEIVEKHIFKILYPSMFYSVDANSQCDYKHVLANIYYVRFIEKGDDIRREFKLFSKRWVQDAEIKCFESLAWIPPPLHLHPMVKRIYNTFDVEKYTEIINLSLKENVNASELIDFFENIVCNGERETIIFFSQYLYHLMKYPAVNPQVFIILYSKLQGSGKNTLGYLIKGLMNGMYFTEVSGASYFGSKNFTGKQEFMLKMINEIGATQMNAIEQLKADITAESRHINVKHEKQTEIVNVVRLLATVNHRHLSFDGRRFCYLSLSSERIKDTKYFNKVHKAIRNPDKLRCFYEYIKKNVTKQVKEQMKKNEFNFQSAIPSTDFNSRLSMLQKSSIIDRFFSWLLVNIFDIQSIEDLQTKYRNNIFSNHDITMVRFALKKKYIEYYEDSEGYFKKSISFHIFSGLFEHIKFKNKPFAYIKKNCGIRFFSLQFDVFIDYLNQQKPWFLKCYFKHIYDTESMDSNNLQWKSVPRSTNKSKKKKK